MAAAEARAVWQRAANRCFVQEDAKRAPKLACCQPSCATSKLVDSGPASAADESDHISVNVMPFNRKSSFSNQAPESRWWLHSQHSYGYQKGLTYALEDEVERLKASDENKTYKGDATQFGYEDEGSTYHMYYGFQADVMNKAPKDRMQEACGKNSQAFPEQLDKMSKPDKVQVGPVGCSVTKKTNELSLDPDYSWIEGDKTEPWWRTTDRDELASLVSQKSLSHVENCDLPPPQKKYVRRHPCCSSSDGKSRTVSFDWEAKSSGSSNLTAHSHSSLDSKLRHGKQEPSAKEGPSYYASDRSSSYTTSLEDLTEKQHVFERDPGKAELIEALCHSQTRAREAEEAAKQAYAEKEHIVKLVFKQASQLFAYKQWFRLLQLESLYIQIKNNDKPISTLFPVELPWMSYEGSKPRKRKHNFLEAKQERQGILRNDITTYAVALALGLSLVGAGLLLGWTVGWMLPRL
ncbi:hypothetical protein L6164_004046 [Bauhinia variegata]|uniref:Uncharacterized protein n=1 Tax=Bauhinia variegata TaxID=167791 RepID=A0ACB9Q2M5_BAUVA|nr:hypothetical protein L6164_004046 [Bauhinia variegata]